MKVLRADMEEIRRLGEEERRGREMLLVKLKGKEQKREIMRRKRELRGRRENILEDWIREKDEVDIGRDSKEEGQERVWVGYKKIRLWEHWWTWDEKEKVLRDSRSTVKQGLRESTRGRRGDKVDKRKEEGKMQQNSGRAKKRGWRVALERGRPK